MNLERVVFGFFIVLALALNVVFMIGDFQTPSHHSVWVLTAAILVSLIASGLKLGDRSQVGAVLLATSLVADIMLIMARIYGIVLSNEHGQINPSDMVVMLSWAGGALVANLISVTVLVFDALLSHR